MRPTVKGWLTGGTLLAAALTLAACTSSATSGPVAAPTGDHGNVEATSPGPATAPHCGIERWAVKTGTDPAAAQVDLSKITDTSVAALASLPVPAGWSEDASRIAGSAEMQVWRVHATLVKYKAEADSDYHLVLMTADGKTMIAEIPAPACVGDGSPFAAGITHARKQFDQVFAPGAFWQPAGVPVIVTGVGFFDALHGQTGVAQNGIELHPVLDIQIASPNSPSPSALPSTSVSPTSTSAAQSVVAVPLISTAPECVTIAVLANQPDGTVHRTWLEFCGNTGPGSDSPIRDPLGGKAGTLDGAVAIGNGCGTKTAPCVIFGPN